MMILYAKALVIEKDNSKIAIVTCDLIGLPIDIVSEARALVEKLNGYRCRSCDDKRNSCSHRPCDS